MTQPNKDKIIKALQTEFGEIKQVDEGNGGNSWVFKYTSENIPYAIKILRRFDRYERFKEEVSVATSLSKEKGICPILKFNLPKAPSDKNISDLPFFTMPFYENGSLEKIILDSSKDGGWNAFGVFKQIVTTLSNIHSKGYAHRDLKPENILINTNNGYDISDFGLCLDLSKGNTDRVTKQEEIVGSFYYRAPEYLRGKLDASDHRPGDVFSLGRILWSLIVGKQPIGYSDWEFSKIKASVMATNLRKPYIVDQIIVDCTHIDPTKRPSITNLIRIINEWEYEPKSNSMEALKDEILNSEELSKMKENQISSEELQKIKNQFAILGLKTIQDHPLYAQLRDLVNTAFPGRILNAGYSSSWNSYVSDKTTTIADKIVSLPFNVGNLKLAPFIVLECNFYARHTDNKVLFEIAACSIDKNEERNYWCTKPVEFTSYDSKSIPEVSQQINNAMDQVNTWLLKK